MRPKTKTRISRAAGSMAVLAASLFAGAAFAETAEDPGARPDFGPIEVLAGGTDSARKLDAGCDWWISLATPDHSVSTDHSFTAAADSSDDTVLVVRTPEGEFLCDDDGGDGGNPMLFVRITDAGRYDIWVGTFAESNPDSASLELFSTPAELPGTREPDILLEGEFDAHKEEVEIGGRYLADELDGRDCIGFVSGDGPNFAFAYQPGSEPASVLVGAEAGRVDTTLVVRSPSGRWICNDDFSSEDPLAVIRQPEDGTYQVWVGAYDREGIGRQARVAISTGPADFPGPRLAPAFVDPVFETRGTGFLISGSGHVLASHHVIESCSEPTVRRQGYGELDAEVIASYGAAGLALLRIDAGDTLPHATFRDGLSARLGEEVATLGYPGHSEHGPTFTTGVISSLAGFEGNLQEFQHNAEVGNGSNGSPIIDRSGHVIGIVTGSLLRNQWESCRANVNYGISGLIAQVFLKLHNVPYSRAHRDADEAWSEVAEDAQAFTVLVSC